MDSRMTANRSDAHRRGATARNHATGNASSRLTAVTIVATVNLFTKTRR